MANPNSRATLIEYCLRRLGDPVIEINVDPDQKKIEQMKPCSTIKSFTLMLL